MSSNRRSYNARKKRGALTRSEHLAHAKKRGQLATFREDPEANRKLQEEFRDSGAYYDQRHGDFGGKKTKFMGDPKTVGKSTQSTTETETKKMSPFYLSSVSYTHLTLPTSPKV